MERSAHPAEPPGQAVDATRTTRPGVPRERADLEPDPGAHPDLLAPQPDAGALERSGVRRRTPVFGTGQPPRLLSGALRRAAYRRSEQRASRWAILLVADRVDVLEHRLGRGLWLVPVLAALCAGYVLTAALWPAARPGARR